MPGLPRPCENRTSARSLRAFFPTLRHRPRSSDPGRATSKIRIMDIERINAIGNRIADLSERTTALRGYL